jgi:hypothetical protein
MYYRRSSRDSSRASFPLRSRPIRNHICIGLRSTFLSISFSRELQGALAQRGAVRSVTFKGVAPAGLDIYEVQFEKGAWEYRIILGPDGKLEGQNIRPVN